jgi:hypothetical protein
VLLSPLWLLLFSLLLNLKFVVLQIKLHCIQTTKNKNNLQMQQQQQQTFLKFDFKLRSNNRVRRA